MNHAHFIAQKLVLRAEQVTAAIALIDAENTIPFIARYRKEATGGLDEDQQMEDLVPGMMLKGTVRNVVDFGSFVDIGVKQDGLLHRSQIPTNVYLHVGDVINVSILSVEIERGRIGLGWAREE